MTLALARCKWRSRRIHRVIRIADSGKAKGNAADARGSIRYTFRTQKELLGVVIIIEKLCYVSAHCKRLGYNSGDVALVASLLRQRQAGHRRKQTFYNV